MMSCSLWYTVLQGGETKMKIDRLIAIITVLLQQEKVTAPELAERFEVSRRTINRDIEDICKAGIPLVTTRGYGGGVSVADGYKINQTLFTEDELQTVLTALKGIDSVSKTSYLARLSDKLFCKGGAELVMQDVIVIDLASHNQKPLTEKIDAIKKAIWEKRQIAFQYHSNKGEQKRRIEPYRLVFQWSSWYVFGYCLDRQAFRLFKLNRLWELEILSELFTGRDIPAEELNFGKYFDNRKFHLKALFSKSEKSRLIDEYGICCYSEDAAGRLLFEWDFVSYENMREWIFSFGDKVTVLEPELLRDDRIRQADNILKNRFK